MPIAGGGGGGGDNGGGSGGAVVVVVAVGQHGRARKRRVVNRRRAGCRDPTYTRGVATLAVHRWVDSLSSSGQCPLVTLNHPAVQSGPRRPRMRPPPPPLRHPANPPHPSTIRVYSPSTGRHVSVF